MRYITTVLIIVSTLQLFSQTDIDNLKKYWYYRERLKKFVVANGNYNEPGTYIPAAYISKDKQTIYWGDGNAALNQYISVLATEYRLLRRSDQDYSQTINELYCTLKAFERLDRTAESYFNGSQPSNTLNGFFIRMDTFEPFWEKYKKNGSEPHFDQNIKGETKLTENSLDNCIHLLEALRLAYALLDRTEDVNGVSVDFRSIIKNNAIRIIDNMYHQGQNGIDILRIDWLHDIASLFSINYPFSEKILPYTWFLKNPVTGDFISDELGGGRDGTMCYASYGFAKNGNFFAGYNRFEPMRYSDLINLLFLNLPFSVIDSHFKVWAKWKLHIFPPIPWFDLGVDMIANGERCKIFKTNLNLGIGRISLGESSQTFDSKTDDYKIRSLCATGNINITPGKNPYGILTTWQHNHAYAKYEHLPLIWAIANDNTSDISQVDRTFVKDLLNEAPTCDPYKFLNDDGITMDYAAERWSSESRLIWPERCTTNDAFQGYFNGLDYMLLHNLYWLTTTINTYPEEVIYFEDMFSCIIGGEGPRMNTIASNIRCGSQLASCVTPKNFIASNEIVLSPGFSVKSNLRKFSARITNGDGSTENPLHFHKIPLDDYPSCEAREKNSTKVEKEISMSYPIEIEVFPNPFYSQLNIKCNGETTMTHMKVFSVTGTLIKDSQINDLNYYEVGLSHLENGIYILKIFDSAGNVHNHKISKQ